MGKQTTHNQRHDQQHRQLIAALRAVGLTVTRETIAGRNVWVIRQASPERRAAW